MKSTTLLRSGLLALLSAGFLHAAEPAAPAKDPAPTKDQATAPAKDQTAGDTVKLPTVQVTEKRVQRIDNEIKKVEKQIAREKKKLKTSDLDKAINSDQLTKGAAIFGGNSASHMIAVAATRVSLLETERNLLERLKFPRTEEDQALIEKELVSIRTTRRNLDDAAKQR